jgi:hypothetical protein
MSTIKSSTEHLTLNADGSGKDIKFQANGVEKASISSTGAFTSTSIDATKLSGTVPNFTSTGIDDNATSTAMTIENDGEVKVQSGVNTSTRTFLVDNAHSGGSMYNALGVYVGATDRMVTLSAEYNDSIMAFRTNSVDRLKIMSAGDVVIGAAYSPTAANGNFQRFTGTGGISQFGVTGTNNLQQIQFFNGNGGVGGIWTNGSATSYNTSSDYRLKENVDYDWDATTRLKQLKPARFNFIADADKTVDGFIAHEAATVVPECVTGTKDAMRDEEYEVTPAVMDGETVVTEAVMGTRSVPDYQGIDQSKLVPLLVASLQEAVAKIEALEARVTALEV